MARTVVTVVGCAKRVSGKTKSTGKPYDFQKVAVSFVNQWGDADVAVCSVDGPVLDKLGVTVDKRYDAVVNTAGGRTYIDLLEEVPE